MDQLPRDIDDYIKQSIDHSLDHRISSQTLEAKVRAYQDSQLRLQQQNLFILSKLKEKDKLIERAKREASMNAQALKKFVEENQRLALECDNLLGQCQNLENECVLYDHDREALMEFRNDVDERAREARQRVIELERDLLLLEDELKKYKHHNDLLSMYNKTRHRGLAFVEMGSTKEALQAMKNLESTEFEGRIIKLNYAKPKKKKIPPPTAAPKPEVLFNLFVANLSYEARSKDLKEFFYSGIGSGSVVSAEAIFHDNPRKPSGYGFVSFKSKKQAGEALSEFEGKIFMGRPIRVAHSNRFVKLSAEESAKSKDASSELSVNEAEANLADKDASSELSENEAESDKAD